MVTMRDIARELQVSVSTVSRAMSQPHLLADETVARVRAASEQMRYRLNLTARDLRRQQTRTLLVMVPSFSPFFLEIFRGAELEALERDYTALMAFTDRDADQENRILDEVLRNCADGVVLLTSADPDRLRRRPFSPPIVAAMDEIEALDLPTVQIDNVSGAAEATRHLIGLGHRRIAHVSGPPRQAMALHRVEGFRQAVAEAGLAEADCLVTPGDFTVVSGEQAMARLLTRYPRPTAIFAANDEMAVGVLQAARRDGLAVPEALSVIGFDDQRIGSLHDPPLTTIAVPKVELGRAAMSLLLDRLEGRELRARVTVLPTALLVRGTTSRLMPQTFSV